MITILIAFVISAHFCVSDDLGTLVYIGRIRYVGLCYPSDFIFTLEGTSTPYKTVEVWNGQMNWTEDFHFEKMTVNAQKCGQGYFPCEKFVNINIKRNDILPFLSTPNQLWSPVWHAIHPKPNVPNVSKNLYQIINATLDHKSYLMIVPEMVDYSWILQIHWYSTHKKHTCFEIQGHVITYIVRNRSKKRKN